MIGGLIESPVSRFNNGHEYSLVALNSQCGLPQLHFNVGAHSI
jgi:hypothetical protein